MNNTNLTIATKDGVSKLIKPKFGPGMLLRAEDLDLLKDYTRDLNRLMFRSLFGCGVVCGLVVDVYEDCGLVIVQVGSGLAIACSGDPIYVPKDVTFPLHDDCDDVAADEEVWVMLCSKEKCCGPRTSVCASDDDDSPVECTREKDWWEIRVVSSPPECVCSCIEPTQPNQNTNQTESQTSSTSSINAATTDETDCKCATGPCYADHYDGKCTCHCGDCSDCDCKCVLLAYAKWDGEVWKKDHSVRRFVRPVLMRDPQPAKDNQSMPASAQQVSTVPQSVKQAAYNAAAELVRQEAEKAAQKAAQSAAQKVAKEIGERAADLVIKQVVDDVARQAAKDAIAREMAVVPEATAPAAAPAEAPPQTEETETKPASKTSKQATKKSGLPGQ